VDLTNERVKTTCQRFVDKYLELLQSQKPSENIFEATASALKEEGIRLRTIKEVEHSTSKATPEAPAQVEQKTVSGVFGEDTVNRRKDEEGDFIIENDISEKNDCKKNANC